MKKRATFYVVYLTSTMMLPEAPWELTLWPFCRSMSFHSEWRATLFKEILMMCIYICTYVMYTYYTHDVSWRIWSSKIVFGWFYVFCFFCDFSSCKRCFWDASTETRIDLNLQTSCKPATNSCKTQYSVPPTFHSLRFIYPYVLLVGSFKLAATRNHVFHCLSCQVVTAVALFYGGKLAMEGTKKKTQTLLSMFWNWWFLCCTRCKVKKEKHHGIMGKQNPDFFSFWVNPTVCIWSLSLILSGDMVIGQVQTFIKMSRLSRHRSNSLAKKSWKKVTTGICWQNWLVDLCASSEWSTCIVIICTIVIILEPITCYWLSTH